MLLNYMSSLYILDINPLLNISFEIYHVLVNGNMSFHSGGHIFILSTASFAM